MSGTIAVVEKGNVVAAVAAAKKRPLWRAAALQSAIIGSFYGDTSTIFYIK
jgi:hypothetical protein